MKFQSRLLYYAQMLDSSLPIGGFSHSFGLETYVQAGKISTVKQLEDYIHAQIQSSLVPLEGLAIKGIYKALDDTDFDEVCKYDSILHTSRLSMESREGMNKMGKRLFKLAQSLYPWVDFDPFETAIQQKAYGTLATIHAFIAHHLDISCNDAVKGYIYTSITALVNSAIRLMSIGQTEGQSLIRRSIPVIDAEWEQTKTKPADELYSFAAMQEIQAMNHETLYSRLFMS